MPSKFKRIILKISGEILGSREEGEPIHANKMALYTTILPKADAIQATRAWCVLFATKGII